MIKYQSTYRDTVNNEVYYIYFDFIGFDTIANPVVLGLAGDPGRIEDKGSDETLIFGIMDSKLTINLLMPEFNESIYKDFTDIEDNKCWVTLCKDGNISDAKWSGWLIADESKRTFNKHDFELSLTCVSPFSLMKGITLTASDNISYLYRLQPISTIIRRCIEPALNVPYNIVIESVNKSFSKLSETCVLMESFNDENGRPPNCFDMLKNICSSLQLNAYWTGKELYIKDPVANITISLPLKIHLGGKANNILINNSENITKVKGLNEVSLKLSYGTLAGLLPNGAFNGTAPNGSPDSWITESILSSSGLILKPVHFEQNVFRLGIGSRFNPYRVRINENVESNMLLWDAYGYRRPPTFGLWNTVNVGYAEKFRLKVRFKYFDYDTKYNNGIPNQKIPVFLIYVMIHNKGYQIGKTFYLSYVEDYKSIHGVDLSGGAILPDIPFPRTIQTYDAAAGGGSNRNVWPIRVGVESTPDIQTYDVDFWPDVRANSGRPVKWNLYDKDIYVCFAPVYWPNGKPDGFQETDNWIDIIDVTLSSVVYEDGQEKKGEEHYLTQNKNYTRKSDQDSIYFGNYSDKSISGALLTPDGSLMKYFAGNYTLQQVYLRTLLAFYRNTRYKADIESVSSDLTSHDDILFKDGDADLIPGEYVIVSKSTSLKTFEHNITAIQSFPEFKNIVMDHDPTDNFDLYELYKTN